MGKTLKEKLAEIREKVWHESFGDLSYQSQTTNAVINDIENKLWGQMNEYGRTDKEQSLITELIDYLTKLKEELK